MSDQSSLGVGQLIFTDDGRPFEGDGGHMYNAGSHIVLVGGAGSGSDGGSIQLWFYQMPEFWKLDHPLDGSWKAEYLPKSDPSRKYTASAGKISAVVRSSGAIAIVAFKFTAPHPSAPITREIEGFWHCKGFSSLTKDSIRND